ncbi:MAG: bacteriophage holin [Saccharopolyspora sp.]|uniref:bacteriophage holin n=1 Tax=Saccharopolyspora TaxID=1835 RepID=UPI00190B3B31|nr:MULTISPECIES: bacteriophage holin [unclassified Saccharopolyspora]MBK0866992.1 bacteriophage holin [Saccharopolyspora sp. HNM0986]MBQ6643436.1 bacteriophage holin [Saccharopolyspora sp.]
MPYIWSLVLLVLGVVLLLAFLIRLFGALRRARAVQRRVVSDLADRTGMLKARAAGLRVAVSERRNGAA